MVWNLRTGQWKGTLSGGWGEVKRLAITPDGTGIVAVGKGNTARFWEVGVKAVGPAVESQKIRKLKVELAWREELDAMTDPWHKRSKFLSLSGNSWILK